jgi:predicted protein tyrosine phosphatase
MGKHPVTAVQLPPSVPSSIPNPDAPAGLPFRLSVCGKSEVDNFVQQSVTHLLSVEDPGTPKETPGWFNGVHAQLLFHDVETLEEARMMGAAAVTGAQVSEILHFGRECLKASRRQPVHLLVHCFAGISRSTAACFAIAAQALGPDRAAQALELVVRIRPEAFPNLRVVKHADRLLGRKGELVRALAPLRGAYSQAVDQWAIAMSRNAAGPKQDRDS